MKLLPGKTANATKYELYVALVQSVSQRNVIIIDLDALLEISFFNCDLVIAIDNLETVPIAGLVLPKNSQFQKPFEFG